jgi:hypothetical protein
MPSAMSLLPRTPPPTKHHVTCLGFSVAKMPPLSCLRTAVRAPLQLVRAPSSISHKIQHHQNLGPFFPSWSDSGEFSNNITPNRRHQQPCLTGVSAPQTLSHIPSASMREIPCDPASFECLDDLEHCDFRAPKRIGFGSLILTGSRVRGPSPWLSGVPAAQARCPPQGKGQVVSENLEA